MSKPIYELVNELPTSGPTVSLLKALDFIVPGQWENLTGFENTIKRVTGETDQALIQKIGERAIHLYNDKSQGYQRAIWLYQTVNSVGGIAGASALANKIGESVSFLSFLDKLTPKADKAQAIDFTLKLVVELAAFCLINGIPGDSIKDFVRSLADYGNESLTRIATLVCVDGLLPLGPDCIKKIDGIVNNMSVAELQENKLFNQIRDYLPGKGLAAHMLFIREGFNSSKDWMANFITSKGVNPQKVVSSLRRYIDVSDNKLDYVAAFLDITTNYYEYTGVQTVARRLIERAVAEI